MKQYLANSLLTQALSESNAARGQAERRRRFAALQLSVPGLITAAELQKKIRSKPPKKVAGKETNKTRINLGRFHA